MRFPAATQRPDSLVSTSHSSWGRAMNLLFRWTGHFWRVCELVESTTSLDVQSLLRHVTMRFHLSLTWLLCFLAIRYVLFASDSNNLPPLRIADKFTCLCLFI
eukprot:GHVN01074934.1.p1 GENE.GHVN01074934.1~~GHVN01074934.1.p1  ORF type:complete len:103 (+),score=3.17 GHVN01074934.1:89-397(+)